MRITTFAPHLAGRMLPGLFSPMPFAKKPRFPGDPWATTEYSPTWFWMHTSACTAHPKGALHGLYRSHRIEAAHRLVNEPRRQADIFEEAAA